MTSKFAIGILIELCFVCFIVKCFFFIKNILKRKHFTMKHFQIFGIKLIFKLIFFFLKPHNLQNESRTINICGPNSQRGGESHCVFVNVPSFYLVKHFIDLYKKIYSQRFFTQCGKKPSAITLRALCNSMPQFFFFFFLYKIEIFL